MSSWACSALTVLPVTHADVRSDDWSEEVSPFWGEVIKSALTAEGIAGLLKAGWTTIKVGRKHVS